MVISDQRRMGFSIVAACLCCAVVSSPSQAQLIEWPVSSGGNGHFYERVTTLINWADARVAAEASVHNGVHGHLASITSSAEQIFVFNSITQHAGGYWLGGYQLPGSAQPASGWVWTTGEPMSYSGWSSGEPNDGDGTESGLEQFMDTKSDGWNDLIGTALNNGYIVEYSLDLPTSGCDIWQPLGSGLNANVFVLESLGGQLFAGGEFQGLVARWNGSGWQLLGGGLSGSWVESMVVFNGELVVGGLIPSVNHVARWTGSTWQPFGGGLSDFADALTVHDGLLIAGVGSTVMSWNGSTWQSLGSGPGGGVRALAVYNGELIAGCTSGVAHWNGTTWQALGTGVGGTILTLAVYNGELMAGGVGGVAHWNGSAWQPLGSGLSSIVHALSVFDGDLIAGGTFTSPGSHIVRWNGSSWLPIGPGMNEQVIAATAYNSELVAGGFFGAASGLPANHIARWRDCNPLPHPGVTNPPTVPVYSTPPPPTPTQHNLVVIAHGCCLDASSDLGVFWEPFEESIRLATDPATWQVYLHDWTPSGSPNPLAAPMIGLNKAIHAEAPHLAATLAQRNYEFIHFIGHSAGSGLIAETARLLRDNPIVSPQPVLHTTFLDAFAASSIIPYQHLYGAPPAHWADHYYSRELFGLTGGPGMGGSPAIPIYCLQEFFHTGPPTQQVLSRAYNIDVSLADPGYDSECLSSHAWPYCYYSQTVGGASIGQCLPAEPELIRDFGFPLSFEHFNGKVSEWLGERLRQYPLGQSHVLTPAGAGAADGNEAELVLAVRHDPPISLATAQYQASEGGTLVVSKDGTGFTATTRPESAKDQSDAWITLGLDLAQVVSIVQFDMNFASLSDARGVLTIYVDDEEVGFLDEQYISLASGTYSMQTAGDLAPGLHTLSFRLDQFGKVPSTASVANIATGYGAFVPPGDLNFDQVVNSIDLGILLSSWTLPPDRGCSGTACNSDLNGDGVVNTLDLGILLANWTL